jgi:hypothetical protein
MGRLQAVRLDERELREEELDGIAAAHAFVFSQSLTPQRAYR